VCGRRLGVVEVRDDAGAVVRALVTDGRRDETETRVVVVLFAAGHHQQATPGGIERQRAQPLRRPLRRRRVRGTVGVEATSRGQRRRTVHSAAPVNTCRTTHDSKTPFTRCNLLSNRLDNRLDVCIHDTTCCPTGCQTV